MNSYLLLVLLKFQIDITKTKFISSTTPKIIQWICRELHSKLLESQTQNIERYSDTAADIHVGASFWIPHRNHVEKSKLSVFSSSFPAEAVALIKSLEFCKDNNIFHVNSFSNSTNVLTTLTHSHYIGHELCPLFRDIKGLVNCLKNDPSGSTIRFSWCPAH